MAQAPFPTSLPWHDDLLSLHLDRHSSPAALIYSFLYAQPPAFPAPSASAIALAASLRPSAALTHSACALLHALHPSACLSPCTPLPIPHALPAQQLSLHAAAVVSPLAVQRNGGLGGAAHAPGQPWALEGQLPQAASAGPAWGRPGVPHNSTRQVALATLRLPTACAPLQAPSSALPWSSAYSSSASAQGSFYLTLARPHAPAPPLATWSTGPATHAPLPATLASATLGTGFARTLALSVSGLPRTAGTLALLLHLPPTAFVDLDELQQAQLHALRGTTAAAFTPYLDIERPAPASSQHTLLLRTAVEEGGGGWSCACPCTCAMALQAVAGSPCWGWECGMPMLRLRSLRPPRACLRMAAHTLLARAGQARTRATVGAFASLQPQPGAPFGGAAMPQLPSPGAGWQGVKSMAQAQGAPPL